MFYLAINSERSIGINLSNQRTYPQTREDTEPFLSKIDGKACQQKLDWKKETGLSL